MSITPEWVTAIAAIISASAIIFLIYQNKIISKQTNLLASQNQLLEKQIKEDHDRSRKSVAIELLDKFITRLKPELFATRKLFDEISDDVIMRLRNENEVTFPPDFCESVKNCIGEKKG